MLKTILTIAVCGSIITMPVLADTSSKTDLSKIGSAVHQVKNLLTSTVAAKIKPVGAKMPDITTSYVLGQGITVHISAIDFIATDKSGVSQSLAPQAQSQSQDSHLLAGTKMASYRQKSKEMAHKAHHLRQKSKSLQQSLHGAQGNDKAKLDQQINNLRQQMKTLDERRKTHARKVAEAGRKAHSRINMAKPAIFDNRQFYSKLEQSVINTLCRRAMVLSALDDNEKVSVVYQLKTGQNQQGYSVSGWTVDKFSLSGCGQGAIDQQQLAKLAVKYQY